MASRKNEQRRLRVLGKREDVRVARPQNRLDFCGAAVSQAQPDYVRWRSAEDTSLPEVVVLGDDREPMRTRIRPYDLVIRGGESELAHVCGLRIESASCLASE